MTSQSIVFTLAVIFTGAAILAALSLYARQSLLVAYIVLGGALGPWGLELVTDASTIQQIGHVGIIFLLYLLGLNLHPQKLLQMLRQATRVTFGAALAFSVVGWLIALGLGFALGESVLIGAAMMFSSTIIGLKLLPATTLHHKHMGEAVISILLLQDMAAIVILLVLEGMRLEGIHWWDAVLLALSLPALAGFALLFERYVLMRLIARFDTIREYIFLTAIGWCLGIALLAHSLGLSYEIGAFIAGVAVAASPISFYIAESLRPLRDFFLILFFFSLGASFDMSMLSDLLLPAGLLAGVMLVLKPLVFRLLLVWEGEPVSFSWEVGVRLGQISEFALLIAILAEQAQVIGERASSLIQTATLISFVVSSYLIMLRYPTPIAVNDRLRRD